MKIVVIGGTGLVGSKLVALLDEHGHEAIAAAPNTGVNTLTGEGLAEALTNAAVVVDVSNSPSLEGDAALQFFQTSTSNLLAAEAAAGVGHHVALSVVGTGELAAAGSGYFRAKLAQETLIAKAHVPYSIVHATQFFEFLRGITDEATDGDTVRLAPVYIQPMAAADVAEAAAITAVNTPLNRITEVAGPQRFRLDELVRTTLASRDDPRTVLADPSARYFGAEISEHSLTPREDATIFDTRLEDWDSTVAQA
ncbi:SDR family oxidoreductase [Mycolicibacterium sp. YH-1]|uniref:SDR family oxidoreductase n=1 Tax=Mycolicibacterium sp. YH-1 TaxID=2908837 RepID=UPI001F4C47FF|nr:SDR family oxidoreductase [Mycolicibacterium sp. YH-1]UNB52093.1 SDR family oxidoreductase [Mycolicibacterium sp. YH-1]